MLKKKRVLIAKISRLESEVFESFLFTRQGLMNSLGLLERVEQKTWKELMKDYKAPEDKTLSIDHKKRELYYEDFVPEKAK